jgi:exodeoxyribonuclease VII large subunit
LLDDAGRGWRERLDALWRVAELAHPNKPLARGYARVEDRDGATLTTAAAARAAARLRLIFADGEVEAATGAGAGAIGGASGGAGTGAGLERPRRAAYRPPPPDQPKLI